MPTDMSRSNINIILADYNNPQHAQDVVMLLDSYACDVMGGGAPLPESVKTNLVAELAKRPYAFSVLCYLNNQAVGLVNCFEAFSTFACRPIINIHDVVVSPAARGLGLSQQLLQKVEEVAKQRGACKLTLEVLEGNHVAQHSYEKFGFAGYVLDPAVGRAMFWQKKL